MRADKRDGNMAIVIYIYICIHNFIDMHNIEFEFLRHLNYLKLLW